MEIKFKTKWRPILKDKKSKRLKCYTLKELVAHLKGLQEVNSKH